MITALVLAASMITAAGYVLHRGATRPDRDQRADRIAESRALALITLAAVAALIGMALPAVLPWTDRR
jgi:hypothetical protein